MFKKEIWFVLNEEREGVGLFGKVKGKRKENNNSYIIIIIVVV